MLARSKLNKAGSLGSKNGPPKAIWDGAVAADDTGSDDCGGIDTGNVGFAVRVNAGDVGDGALKEF
jgi:hypothetical protein